MPLAVVTGASGGIGLEMCRLLAAHHTDLVLVARSESRLRDAATELTRRYGVSAEVVTADLSDASGPSRVAARVGDLGRPVDVLINNAGFGLLGRFAAAPLDRQLEMLQVNVSAVTALTRLFLPAMLERRSGRIMNVASTAAFQPGPGMAVYYASKAYVLSFSFALSVELKRSGVTVTALCPGPTLSGFQRTAGIRETGAARALNMRAVPVALAGYRGMMRGRRVVTPGIRNKAWFWVTRVLPRTLAATLAGWHNVRRETPGDT